MAEEREPISGLVAEILTHRELVLNVGKRDGVEVGMCFDVLFAKGEDITDPETEEILGSLRRPKIRVKVSQVHDRMSVAKTFRTRRVNLGGQGFGLDLKISDFAASLLPPEWVERPETLRTADKPWQELDESESFVKIGDPVIEVKAETESNAQG